ncbi:unnamed protein product [Brachionus calyciflorus]|uniref:C-type lectin domain-containing protein n=1 Tax=Brachionus calyciflorus TaxID=104777 RepID=A0A813MUJ2_9BILA|nr:unnamed protein product [Brachionus calyciflorus]
MFSENATKSLIPSLEKITYRQIDKMIQLEDCSDENKFISLNNYSCVQCPANFKKYSKFPFACYQKLDTPTNFTNAKLNCEQMKAFLIRPKSDIERSLLNELFGNSSEIWVDSQIKSLNETFRWNDGTKVGGFTGHEPNNKNGNGALHENSIVLKNGLFSDVPESFIRAVVCQFN